MRPRYRPLLAALVLAATPLAPASGQTPSLILRPPEPGPYGGFGRAIVTADLDGDGGLDIHVGSTALHGSAYLVRADGSLAQTYVSPFSQYGGAFGQAVAVTDDVDGDGVRDVLVGAPEESQSPNQHQGRAYVLSGATGDSLFTLRSPAPTDYGGFGSAVAAPGDLDGDGTTDYVVGAYGERQGATLYGAGHAYVFSGLDGHVIRTLASPSPSLSGFFGHHVAAAGDLTGDGVPELLISAPRERIPPSAFGTKGRVHLFDGATGVLVRSFETHAPDSSPWFGRAATLGGDLDGDGDDDLIVAAPEESDGGGSGVVYAFDLATGDSLQAYDHTAGGGYLFGSALAPVGDVDADGFADFVASVPAGNAPAQMLSGLVHVVSGATGANLLTFASPNPSLNGYFGDAATWADLDGDGAPDPIIGAPYERFEQDPETVYGGAVYLYTSAAIRSALTVTAGEPLPGGLLALEAPAPNPATSRTTLAFLTDRPARVRLALYDALGREVARPVDGDLGAGRHTSVLDTHAMAPGVYVARLTDGTRSASVRLTVVR